MSNIINKEKPVRLIRCILLMAAAFFFYGCKNKKDIELRVKNRECQDKLMRNRYEIKRIIDLLDRSTNRRYIALKKKSIYVDSLREVYTLENKRKDLLTYSDTVINRYRKIDLPEPELLSDWESLRSEVLTADSSEVLDFYYLTLAAERELSTGYLADIAIDRFDKTFTSFIPANRFLFNDTVTFLVRISFFEPTWDFDFSKITCKNTVTNEILTPHAVKVGPHYIFYYRPRERGTYVISGNSRFFAYDQWHESEPVRHQFVVE